MSANIRDSVPETVEFESDIMCFFSEEVCMSPPPASPSNGLSRRRLIGLVAAGTVTGLAGCTGDDDEPTPDGPTPTPDDPTPTPPADTNGPPDTIDDFSMTVTPSGDAITYGEEYSVDVVFSNGSDQEVRFRWNIEAMAGVLSRWRIFNGYSVSLGPGEDHAETVELVPPIIGTAQLELTMEKYWPEELTLTEHWQLDTAAPRVAFGQESLYYEGLAVDIDLELRDSMPLPVNGTEREITAPPGTQWAQVLIGAENTNTDDSVGFWRQGLTPVGVHLLHDDVQQEEALLYYETSPGFEDQLDPGEAIIVYNDPDWFDYSVTLPPESRAEGWRLFTTPEELTTDALEVALVRGDRGLRGDVTATWTNQ